MCVCFCVPFRQPLAHSCDHRAGQNDAKCGNNEPNPKIRGLQKSLCSYCLYAEVHILCINTYTFTSGPDKRCPVHTS